MTLAGIKPLGILSTIRRTNNGSLSCLRTLYNERVKVRTGMIAGRTPLQTLLDNLRNNAWTSKELHFCKKATSRVEGAHAYIKKFLQVSTGDLLSVFTKLTLAVEHQVKAEEAKRSEEKMHHLLELPSVFKSVSGKISRYALKRCLTEFGKLEETLELCAGIFHLPWESLACICFRN
ncbi:hypothetical protein OnM2_020096 [Erysiphe neolycopersici]|uniref:Uncharacterized protein n=1 Tax=Erysiphe neolycopersici TaxID=212602 RepID=A0A420I3F6_9PEZI|nr:hypothetical protein OnM2_020096 [Erysiphe neolycopersici]